MRSHARNTSNEQKRTKEEEVGISKGVIGGRDEDKKDTEKKKKTTLFHSPTHP